MYTDKQKALVMAHEKNRADSQGIPLTENEQSEIRLSLSYPRENRNTVLVFPIGDIIPVEENPYVSSRLKASLLSQGLIEPLVLGLGGTVGRINPNDSARLAACKELGWDTVIVVGPALPTFP